MIGQNCESLKIKNEMKIKYFAKFAKMNKLGITIINNPRLPFSYARK